MIDDLCKTKPNLGRMGHLGDGASGRGPSCKTNPIARGGAPRRCPATPVGPWQVPGGCGRWRFCAKNPEYRLGHMWYSGVLVFWYSGLAPRKTRFWDTGTLCTWHVACGGLDSGPPKRGWRRAGMPGSREPPDVSATCAAPATAFCPRPHKIYCRRTGADVQYCWSSTSSEDGKERWFRQEHVGVKATLTCTVAGKSDRSG